MDKQKIKRICFLPVTMIKSGKSIYELLSGFNNMDFNNDFIKKDLKFIIKNNPELIENWLTYSSDKEPDPGFFFNQIGSNYELGFINKNGEKINSELYENKYVACSLFIYNEILEIIKE